MIANIVFEDCRKTLRYDVAFCSGIGKRETQQDKAYCYVDDRSVYAVVCDGMGGLGGGELASAMGIHCASSFFKKNQTEIVNSEDKNEWMANLIIEADQKVHNLQTEDGKRVGGGSTLVSAWIQDNKLYWASVGDSRIYIFRRKECVQLTVDLNYTHILDQRLETGEIDEEEYQKEIETGEALVSFLGHGNIELIDRNLDALPLQVGDSVVLCTDGLYRTIDKEWMGELLTACKTMDEVVTFIHTIIKEHGKEYQDNYTCVLIRVYE